MDFIDTLKQFSKRVNNLKDTIQTEEATKTSILLPFFQLMGFDIFNPNEVVPEYTTDVGIKKGEKVDYAILKDNEPIILVEAKAINEKLENHDSQLFRYFGTSKAKFAILTNGIEFRFYSDLDEPNKMDETPFMIINILDIKDNQIAELKKFHQSNFDICEVLSAASELKYSNEIKKRFQQELNNPTTEFVKMFLIKIYSGKLTQNVIDKFRPVVKKALNQYISEALNDKIKNALETANKENSDSDDVPENKSQKISPTPEELEAYFIVKNCLKNIISPEDITYKNTESYLGILYKHNTRKWLCRFIFTPNQKILIIPDKNKKDIKIQLSSIYDIEKYTNELKDVLSRYLDKWRV